MDVRLRLSEIIIFSVLLLKGIRNVYIYFDKSFIELNVNKFNYMADILQRFSIFECLEQIFSNLLDENPSRNIQNRISTKDLHSCTLVSRHWCRISTPFLYTYPFHHFRHLAYLDFYLDDEAISYFKLIRTLLNCIPKIEIEQIITTNNNNNDNNNKEISFIHNLTTFNYVKFIRGLIFDQLLFNTRRLLHYQEIWFPTNNDNKMEYNQYSIPIIYHLIKFLCKHCNNLTILEFPFTIQNNGLFHNMIELLINKDNNNGRNKLINLRDLYYIDNINRHDDLLNLYLALTNNVCNLNLIYHEKIDSIEKANSLSKFISLQKNLQHIILTEDELASLFYIFDDINIDYYYKLPKIFPNELISIFKSCNKLVYLSAILSDHNSWDEHFRILGKFIPKKLQKIRFKKMDHFVFSSNELKCFLEECVKSNSKLKYLEISGKCSVKQEYFNVANQFEIHLI
ncbi:hypothetical protein GLOIN_2v1769492 [Rhizophagus irregularis DAOM 181602=DAOM 197198]|nr:hypothetical protein GLOIN_2v1769492 [Rhizophagus irregularis DAOM 181602=DAOM 197198]